MKKFKVYGKRPLSLTSPDDPDFILYIVERDVENKKVFEVPDSGWWHGKVAEGGLLGYAALLEKSEVKKSEAKKPKVKKTKVEEAGTTKGGIAAVKTEESVS